MTLLEAIRGLDSLDERGTIYAAEPWSATSCVVIALETESGEHTAEAGIQGLTYFLEISVAREFLEGWIANLGRVPSLEEKASRLIQYARTDA